MQLSPEIIESVRQWVNVGATIAEVQTRLNEQLSTGHLTYREVRFLLDDLGLEIQVQKAPAPIATPDLMDATPENTIPGSVQVTLEPIQRPGYLACGQVTFSDGKNAEWRLDSSGRLALIPAETGYRPSGEDQMAFQQKLREVLS